MSLILSAEAFGTLLAMSDLRRIRSVDPKVRRELVEGGLAEDSGEFLLITPAGRQLAETRDIPEALGLVPSSARRTPSDRQNEPTFR